MNIIKVNVNFEKRIIYKSGIDLTSGDYNSTKLMFEFDREDGRKVFEMKDPEGNLVLATDIVNNEVDLVGEDENGNKASLFTRAGNYIFEISLYDGESKLTSEFNYIKVKTEQVVVDDKTVTVYLPIFDKLINEVENLNIEMKNGVVTITRKDGSQHSENVNGEDYIITEEDYEEIETNVKSDIQPILDNIQEKADTAISISKGANQALSYLTYADMIINFNAFDKNKFEKSQSVMIKQLNVPDMWIYDLSDEYLEYTYTTDEEVINLLMSDDGLHIGYYILGPLETQKVDLTDYAKKEQFVTLLNEKENEDLSTNGTVTREDGTTLIFSANTYYFIPEEE